MRLSKVLAAVAVLLFTVYAATLKTHAADDRGSLVIVYKDGHRQTLASGEIARLDLKDPATIVYKDGHREKTRSAIDHIEFEASGLSAMIPGRSHYIGKWEVGDGSGNKFFITLEADGDAKKTIGSPHGTWTLVDGEAHISWDDGWHDAIRKVGSRHEKVAHEPGKSFDDPPSNVDEARNTRPKPI